MGGSTEPGTTVYEPFFQKEELHQRIKNILEDYPPGLGPFKEFLQNADDARAERFALILDERRLKTSPSGMVAPALCNTQCEPALLVYNSAVFTDRDFASITSLGQSAKFSDTSKIGKYGLGFNVSYHFSDIVQFISRDQLVIFDPQARSLPGSVPGIRINYLHENLKDKYPGQAAPFVPPVLEAASVMHGMENSMDGTLFRLSLRTPEQARASRISPRSHTTEDIRELLHEFAATMSDMMVFLRNVRNIEIHCIAHDGAFETIARCSSNAGLPASIVDTDPAPLQPLSRRVEQTTELLIGGEAAAVRSQAWLLLEATGVAGACGLPACAEEVLNSTLTAGVAMPLQDNVTVGGEGAEWVRAAAQAWGGANNSNDGNEDEEGGNDATECSGHFVRDSHAYCYLPLPIKTGLPFHVNGSFALSSNRRGLWSEDHRAPVADLSSAHNISELKAEWNRALLTHLAGPLMARAVRLAITEGLVAGQDVWACWPSLDSAVAPFDSAARSFATEVSRHQLPIFWDSFGTAGFLPLDEVAFLSPEDNDLDPDILNDLRAIGAANIVCPKRVTALLRSAKVPFIALSNETVRAAYLRHHKLIAMPGDGMSTGVMMSVLRFLVRRWDRTAVRGEGKSAYRTNSDILDCLAGLPIIPLQIKDKPNALGTLQKMAAHPPPVYYTTAPRYLSLFRGCGRLVDTSSGWSLDKVLPEDAIARLNVRPMTAETLASFGVGMAIPESWMQRDAVPGFAGLVVGGTPEDKALVAEYRKAMSVPARGKDKKEGKKGKKKGKKPKVVVERPYLIGGDDNNDDDDDDDQFYDAPLPSMPGDPGLSVPAHEPAPPLVVPFELSSIEDGPAHAKLLWDWLALSQNASERELNILFRRRFSAIPITTGLVVSPTYAKRRGVMPVCFDSDTHSLLARFGCLFTSVTHQLVRHSAAGVSESNLLHALYDGVTSAASGIPPPYSPDDCRQLRTTILELAKDNFKAQLLFGDASQLRALPLFETVGRSTMRPIAAASASPDPAWDEVLAATFPDDVLDVTGPDARAMLGLAKLFPGRGGRPDDVTFLEHFLLPQISLAPPETFPQALCILMLASVGRHKLWKKPERYHRAWGDLQKFMCVVDDNGQRRRCTECLHPADGFLTELSESMDVQAVTGMTPPPAEYSANDDVMSAMTALGMKGSDCPEVFLKIAEAIEATGSVPLARKLWIAFARVHHGGGGDKTGWGTESGVLERLGRMKIFVAYDARQCVVPPRRLARLPAKKEQERMIADRSPAAASHRRTGGRRAPRWEATVDDGSVPSDDEGMAPSKRPKIEPKHLRSGLVASMSLIRESWLEVLDSGAGGNAPDDLAKLPQLLVKAADAVAPGPDAFVSWAAAPVLTPLVGDISDGILYRLGVPDVTRSPSCYTVTSHMAALCNLWMRYPTVPVGLRRGLMLYAATIVAGRVASLGGHGKSGHDLKALASVPFVVLDSGDQVHASDVVVDADDGFGGRHALPEEYETLSPLFVMAGSLSIEAGAQPVVVAGPIFPEGGPGLLSFAQSQFNKPDLADVCFLDAETGARLYSHRLVLGVGGEMFRAAMLRKDMRGGMPLPDEPHITVFHVPPHIGMAGVELMLRVLYFGEDDLASLSSCRPDSVTPEMVESVCSLLRASDYYMHHRIREWCEQWMSSKEIIQTHNVLDMYQLAVMCGARQLANVCLYHARLIAPALMTTPEWAALDPEVQDKILVRNRPTKQTTHPA